MAKRKAKKKSIFHSKVLLYYIFGALFLILGIVVVLANKDSNLNLFAATSESSVTVNVTNVLQTGTTGGARLGINIDYWWDQQSNRTTPARSLPSALMDMGAKYWRYPGGEEADGYLWSTPPYTTSNPRLARISSQDWPSDDQRYWTPTGTVNGTWAHQVYNFDQFMSDCKAAGCIPVMVVAYDGIYKPAYSGGVSLTRQQALDTATGWVNYANKVKGYNIKYWEIGNETWNPGYMGADPGRVQQASDVVTFCTAMKKVDPTILCGVNANSQADWTTLLTGAGSVLNFLSVHSYMATPYASYTDYMNSTFNPDSKVDEAYNALLGFSSLKNHMQIAVTETGGITYGTWNQADLGHALMTFDNLAQLQQDNRVAFTQFWTTRFLNQNQLGNVWPYTESEFDALKPDNSFSPQGLAQSLLAKYSLTDMVGTTSTATVRTFASYDPLSGKLNVWLINKSTTANPAKLSLQNYTSGTTATVIALQGTGSSDMYPTIAQLAPSSVVNNQVSLTLSPVSITVLQFPGGTQQVTSTLAPTATVVQSDTTPPSVSLLSPANGSTVTSGKTITLYATASDNEKVANVQFYVNSTLLCTDVSSYSCNWKVPNGKEITYYLSAVANDTSGNASKSTNKVVSQ